MLARKTQNNLDETERDALYQAQKAIRARLERRCPALDYYYGFYVNMTEDGRICAERDAIRSRAGGECRIEDFRTLTAELVRYRHDLDRSRDPSLQRVRGLSR